VTGHTNSFATELTVCLTFGEVKSTGNKLMTSCMCVFLLTILNHSYSDERREKDEQFA